MLYHIAMDLLRQDLGERGANEDFHFSELYDETGPLQHSTRWALSCQATGEKNGWLIEETYG